MEPAAARAIGATGWCSYRPRPACLPERTSGTLRRCGAGIENPRLKGPPDALDDRLQSLFAFQKGRHRQKAFDGPAQFRQSATLADQRPGPHVLQFRHDLDQLVDQVLCHSSHPRLGCQFLDRLGGLHQPYHPAAFEDRLREIVVRLDQQLGHRHAQACVATDRACSASCRCWVPLVAAPGRRSSSACGPGCAARCLGCAPPASGAVGRHVSDPCCVGSSLSTRQRFHRCPRRISVGGSHALGGDRRRGLSRPEGVLEAAARCLSAGIRSLRHRVFMWELLSMLHPRLGDGDRTTRLICH